MTPNPAQVSVVMPTFGRAGRLALAVESLLTQTEPRFELIVVDDNDPTSVARHETEALMRAYEADPRIIYVRHERNRNGAAARNTGIHRSSAPLVCFLDDDDRYLPLKLERQIRFLADQPEIDAVTCGWRRGKSCHVPSVPADVQRALLMMDYHPITSTLMFRREALENIGGFDESFRRHQDVELMIRFSERYRLGFISECLIEVGDNDGENALHGGELDELKRRFLEQFQGAIARLELREPGVGRRVTARHYGRNFLDHAHRRLIFRAAAAGARSFFSSPVEFGHVVGSTTGEYLAHRKRRASVVRGGDGA